MTENRTQTVLQTSSHVLVVGAGLVYFFGFIVISVFDATYGIADFGIFRTKVMAVGTVFLFLIAVAMVMTFRFFSLFGLTIERADFGEVEVTPKTRPFIVAAMAFNIPFACLGLAYPLAYLFGGFPFESGIGFALFLGTAAASAGLAVGARKSFASYPIVFVVLHALIAGAFFLILYEYSSRGTFWFVVWLSLVCVFTLQVSLKMTNRDEARRTEWERLILLTVPLVFFIYADKIYPNIPHQFGGGGPIPIVLHLTKKLPAFDSENVAVSLIDETEQGYYVLRGTDKALFVARNLVEEVEFLRSGSAVGSSPSNPEPPKQ